MNVPYTAVNVPVYESGKKLLGKAGEEEGLLAQVTAGSMAGASAALLTNPLDVVKTRLQLEGVNSATRYGTTAVVRTLGFPVTFTSDLVPVRSPFIYVWMRVCSPPLMHVMHWRFPLLRKCSAFHHVMHGSIPPVVMSMRPSRSCHL